MKPYYIKHTITVVKRSSDFIAYIDGDKSLWGCGKSPNEAVASVVYSHKDSLEISIEEEFDYSKVEVKK